MKKWLDNRWLELACRLLLGGIFVYASIDKIIYPVEFAKVVYNYQILPVAASNLAAPSRDPASSPGRPATPTAAGAALAERCAPNLATCSA